MAFSDLIKKLAETSTLSAVEKDELYLESRRLEEAGSLFNSMVIPGTAGLKVDNFQANNAEIIDATIESATAGGGDVHIGADGIWIKNQQAAFGFEDTNGDRFNLILESDGQNNLVLVNRDQSSGQGSGHVRMSVDTLTGNVLNFVFHEQSAAANAEVPEFYMGNTNPSYSTAGVINIADGVRIWAGKDGALTVFNESGNDIDFRVETDTNPHGISLDAAGETVGLMGASGGVGTVLTADGADKRVEIGWDHFIPIRSASNPNIFFNLSNQDMDFCVRGTTDNTLIQTDAGLDSVGMGGYGESGTKLVVTGDERVTGAVKIGSSGSDVQAYVSGSKFVLKYNDGGTTRYKYLDMAGTGVTWVHTTVAP